MQSCSRRSVVAKHAWQEGRGAGLRVTPLPLQAVAEAPAAEEPAAEEEPVAAEAPAAAEEEAAAEPPAKKAKKTPKAKSGPKSAKEAPKEAAAAE